MWKKGAIHSGKGNKLFSFERSKSALVLTLSVSLFFHLQLSQTHFPYFLFQELFVPIFSRIESGDLLHGLVELPEQPPALKEQLSEIEALNGLSEKFVAVESTIFIVDQFRQIRNIIDQLTRPEDREKIDAYFSQVFHTFDNTNFIFKYLFIG